MILLEIDPISQLWGITPATVFGALAAVLAFANVMQWRKISEKDKEIKEMNGRQFTQLTDTLTTLNGLKSTIDGLTGELRETRYTTKSGVEGISKSVGDSRVALNKVVDDARDKIVEQIGHVKERLPNV